MESIHSDKTNRFQVQFKKFTNSSLRKAISFFIEYNNHHKTTEYCVFKKTAMIILLRYSALRVLLTMQRAIEHLLGQSHVNQITLYCVVSTDRSAAKGAEKTPRRHLPSQKSLNSLCLRGLSTSLCSARGDTVTTIQFEITLPWNMRLPYL